MDWIDHLNCAMEYIEQHLTEKMNYKEIAEVAQCPAYYFQKIFLYMTNISLHEYIRLRRLSLAATDLQKNGLKVIDAAYKYGYESPTAFHRAFVNFHGISPSTAKKKDAARKSYPPIKFDMHLQGGETLSFRIEQKDAFCILGIACPLDKVLENNFQSIPSMWDTALQKGYLEKLLFYQDGEPSGLLGVSVHHQEEWKYFIAVSSHQCCEAFETYPIPASTWAVFSGNGTNRSLQDLERRVILEWLPTSGYQYGNTADIEVYIKADPKDAIYEYWLPIQ